METDEQIKSKFEQIQKNLKETALGVNYIDPVYKKKFTELAKKEYANDYGVCIKELIKVYEGFYPTGHEEIEAKIEILTEEINDLKTNLENLKNHVDSLTKKDITPSGYVRSADGSRLIKK